MTQYNRSSLDRRLTEDRRQIYCIDYFQKGGVERRSLTEQRCNGENRKGWVRIDRFMSVSLNSLGAGERDS